MRQNEIEYFRRSRLLNFEKIENFKLANIGKKMKNKISDFSYSFYGKGLIILNVK